jgi:hypothetical protein
MSMRGLAVAANPPSDFGGFQQYIETGEHLAGKFPVKRHFSKSIPPLWLWPALHGALGQPAFLVRCGSAFRTGGLIV